MSPTTRNDSGGPIICSFCNKPDADVRKMIAGPNGVAICDQCVNHCNDILADQPRPDPPSALPGDVNQAPKTSFACPGCGRKFGIRRIPGAGRKT